LVVSLQFAIIRQQVEYKRQRHEQMLLLLL